MTDNDNPLKSFSEILSFYESPSTGVSTRTNSTTKIMPPRKCLFCGISISSSTLGPYCSSKCMNDRDKGMKIDHKGSEKNTMLKFSEVFRQ